MCECVCVCVCDAHSLSAILQLKDYISRDLLAMIYAAGDQNDMMEESREAAQRREELIHMYHTCNQALELIRDVSSKTGLAGLVRKCAS